MPRAGASVLDRDFAQLYPAAAVFGIGEPPDYDDRLAHEPSDFFVRRHGDAVRTLVFDDVVLGVVESHNDAGNAQGVTVGTYSLGSDTSWGALG